MEMKGLRVPQEVLEVLDRLLELQGLTFSEYVRGLIVKDLDQRGIFTSQLKVKMEEVG